MGVLNAVKKATGNVVKATLIFTQEVDKVFPEPAEQPSSVAALDDVDYSGVAELFEAAEAGALDDMFNVPDLPTVETKEDIFEVQFNPSTIHISARGGGAQAVPNITQEDEAKTQGEKVTATEAKKDKKRDTIRFEPVEPYIEVSFKLIFDYEINSDAFMSDMLGIGNMVDKAVNTVAALARGSKPSIRPVVEGFLGAVRNKEHRQMTIAWGDMSYSGNLNSVTATYTMFSSSGHPIRAEVDFNLMCDAGSENGWEKKYESAFKKSKGIDKWTNKGVLGGESSTGEIGRHVQNLFNL